MKYDIIIIGAGAAGLMAMTQLLEKGYRVCMLEAGNRAGGRMNTIQEAGFPAPVETGAEFVHGNLPLTLQLLREAGISYEETGGAMKRNKDGAWINTEEDDAWERFMHILQQQQQETTIAQFLQQHFSAEKYKALHKAVQNYAEGFDLADIHQASVLSIKEEWSHQEEAQYRITGGYQKLVEYLLQQCDQQHGRIIYDAAVIKIGHQPDHVIAHTRDGRSFEANKILIAVSAGVLQSGMLQFIPALKSHAAAIHQLGFGAVIKVLLQFKTNFWNDYADNIGFILSDETIPTWWTQSPQKNNLLTGWLGGPRAAALSSEKEEKLLQISLASLAAIFKRPIEPMQEMLLQHTIICWHNKPYILGGYSYNTVNSVQAKSVLAQPVDNTIFFAGEATYQGASQGTVEAALQSGVTAAGLLIQAAM